jgi:hypothetical protein
MLRDLAVLFAFDPEKVVNLSVHGMRKEEREGGDKACLT